MAGEGSGLVGASGIRSRESVPSPESETPKQVRLEELVFSGLAGEEPEALARKLRQILKRRHARCRARSGDPAN
jgi:hypothetical protein